MGAAALALLVPTSAAYASPVQDGPAAEEPAPTSDLPAELITALAHDLQLDPQQYLDRSQLAQRLAEFTESAREQFPAVFGGAYLDEAGTPVVALAPGDGRDAAASAVATEGFVVRDVARSESDLQKTIDTLSTWLETQPPLISDLVRGVTLDVVSNGLVVRTDAGAALDLPDFLRAAPVTIAPAPSPAVPPTDLQPIADPATPGSLLGGDGFGALGGGSGLRCSLGFNATTGAGDPVNITAGHCDPNLAAAGTGAASEAFALAPQGAGPRFGTFAKSRLDGLDYALVRADDSSRARFENNGVRVPGAAPLAITGVGQPVVGAPVCKSGTTTGFSCGTVQTAGQSVQVGSRTLDDGFSTNICALQGDSGGPIVSGTMAIGVSSASNVGQYPMCEVAQAVGFFIGQGPELFATPIQSILDDNSGLTVRTN
ncbi:protease [Rhodococcus rhodnii LMG 5362]|uniref:Protease n=1 Tax=Rhodococcus rhodnii LMG 5362 TaxID=1273125 RepID=R7WPM6_9NOCA|nr:protease [Rhodococcus rhodnii LMG 5362]